MAGRVQIGTDIDWTMARSSHSARCSTSRVRPVRRTICNAFGIPIQMIEMNDSGISWVVEALSLRPRTQFLSQTIMPMVVGKADGLLRAIALL